MPEKKSTDHVKVLHISSGDLWAGAEVQLFTLATTLHYKLDVSVSVILLNHGELEQRLLNAGITTDILDETELNWLQIIRSVVRIIRKTNPDVIHTHRRKENIIGSIAALIAGNIPSIRTTHGSPPTPPFRDFRRWTIRQCDLLFGRILQKRIISVSKDLADILAKVLPSKKIYVIENGLDYDSIEAKSINQNRQPGADNKPFRAGIACRLVPVKRVDIFIETACYMRDHFQDWDTFFHIFGDGPIRKQLEALNQRLKTGDIVRFEGHCEEIHRSIQNLDVLLITSDHEGLPMILLEAMALKIPVIAHDVGGIPEVLDHGNCGVLVQNHTASGYGEAIHSLAHSKNISNIITNAAARVRNHYSSERNARAYLSVYTELTNRLAARRS